MGDDHPYGRWQDRYKAPVAQLQPPVASGTGPHDRDTERGEVVEQKVEVVLEEKKDGSIAKPEGGSSASEKGPSNIDVQVMLAQEG